jgi:hypothetical protein
MEPSNLARSVLVVLCTVAAASCASHATPPELVGHWQGSGRIIVTWCEQERLPVLLDIGADGTVAGTIGDARLVEARVRRNRGALGRALHVKTDWIVTGDLDGPVVAAEGIERDGVKLPFNLLDAELKGAVHTTGSHRGGRDSMVLTAADVRLKTP